MPEEKVDAPSVDLSIDSQSRVEYPLCEFYRWRGLPVPLMTELSPDDVPEPYRSLLVHRRDMTPTLEEFYESPIHIRVYESRISDNAYFREVVLVADRGRRPVEYGAIKIELGRLPLGARSDVMEEQLPLGGILRSHSVEHGSNPAAFFRISADSVTRGALQQALATDFFGRRNTLSNPAGEPLAEIVEILPNAETDRT